MRTQAGPKHRLEPFAALIGDWSIEASQPMLDGAPIPGRARFEWLTGERFLVWRTEYEHPQLPDATSVIGAMGAAVAEKAETAGALSMHYFDERGVHRPYGIAFDGEELRTWLDAPSFVQRMTARLSADVATLRGQWTFDENGQGARDDLAITYRRGS